VVAYTNAKFDSCYWFEVGNEPEYGAQGGLTIDEQIHVADIAIDAIREGVRAATNGKANAKIYSCGTNSKDYAASVLSRLGNRLDGISVHDYNNPTTAASSVSILRTLMQAAGTMPVLLSEQGADANDAVADAFETGLCLFNYLDMADPRLQGVLLFKTTSSTTDGNMIMEANVRQGLFRPTKGYFAIRMMYRAGVHRKEVLAATSTDAQVSCLVTRDAERTYFTIYNQDAINAHSYTIDIPSTIPGTMRNVFLFDNSSFLDAPWDGVAVNGRTITVTNQPKRSFAQIVFGATAADPAPQPYDASLYRLTDLENPYLATTDGRLVPSLTLDFQTGVPFIPMPMDTNDVICRAYLRSGGVAPSCQGWRYNNRQYITFNEWMTDGTFSDVLWSHDRISANAGGGQVISVNMGYDQSNGNDIPTMGLIYRDDNGATISAVASPNRANGVFRVQALAAAASPCTLMYSGTAGKVWNATENRSLRANQRVTLTLTNTTVKLNVACDSAALSFESPAVNHGLTLTGTGRVGFARNYKGAQWFDSLRVNAGPPVSITAQLPSMAHQVPRISRSAGLLRISMPHSARYVVAVYQPNGKLIYKKFNDRTGVCTFRMPDGAGMYLVTVTTGGCLWCSEIPVDK
jgi:hypothetical protein